MPLATTKIWLLEATNGVQRAGVRHESWLYCGRSRRSDVGKCFAERGHVILSGPKAPPANAEQVAELGLRTRGQLAEDFIVLAVPWNEVPAALSTIANRKRCILVYATNDLESLIPPRFTNLGGRTSSGIGSDLRPAQR